MSRAASATTTTMRELDNRAARGAGDRRGALREGREQRAVRRVVVGAGRAPFPVESRPPKRELRPPFLTAVVLVATPLELRTHART